MSNFFITLMGVLTVSGEGAILLRQLQLLDFNWKRCRNN